MTLKISGMILLTFSVMMCGCLGPRIVYKGEHLAPTTTVKVINNQTQLKDYRKIGKASISGQYQDYSYDELLADLQQKARLVGADAIYIKTYEVVPDGRAREDQTMNTTPNDAWAMDDDSSDGWLNVDQQMTYEYNEVGVNSSAMGTDIPIYRRVIKAFFLKKK